MGLYDREYSQERYQPYYHYGPPMQMGFPGITTAVKWLLIINIGVFLAVITIKPLGVLIYDWFQLDPTTLLRATATVETCNLPVPARPQLDYSHCFQYDRPVFSWADTRKILGQQKVSDILP